MWRLSPRGHNTATAGHAIEGDTTAAAAARHEQYAGTACNPSHAAAEAIIQQQQQHVTQQVAAVQLCPAEVLLEDAAPGYSLALHLSSDGSHLLVERKSRVSFISPLCLLGLRMVPCCSH
jgi:hypothetical protein